MIMSCGAGGGHGLEELEFVEDPAGAFRDGRQGVVCNMNGQAGLFRHQAIDSPQQGSAAGDNNAAIDEVRREFRGSAFKGDADGLQYARQWLFETFTDFF